jgi:multidrug efflux pump subunit AcrA (membrane-fusion protein)
MSDRLFHYFVILLFILGLSGFIYWAKQARIDEVASAQGQVIAQDRTQVVQAAVDGVIDQLLVHEGDKVSKGQTLVVLERQQAEAGYRDSSAKVAALKANLARLHAEVYGRALSFPADALRYASFVSNQTQLYKRRKKALEQEIAALRSSLALVNQELKINEPLLETGDIAVSDIIRLQRQVSELQGAITNRENKYFQDAQADMTKAEEDLATQEQVLFDRQATLQRTVIHAPADGFVSKIELTTPGAKVKPGDMIMTILPTHGPLIVEAKLKPKDVAYVIVGLPVSVKLDAYDYSVYGVLRGKVSYVSPDALVENTAQGQAFYYRVQVLIDKQEISHGGKKGIKAIVMQPGMTATLDISTGEKTVLSYLTKPITKTMSESLKER